MKLTSESRWNWLRFSVLAQAALAFYFQGIQWLPLGRWNYEPEDLGSNPLNNLPLLTLAQKGQLTTGPVLLVLAFALPFLIFLFAYLTNRRRLMWLQVIPYALWLAIEMVWWVRYVVGYTEPQAERYQRVFGQATQVLPAFGPHLPPDGAHFVLHTLIASALVATILGLLKSPASISRPAMPT